MYTRRHLYMYSVWVQICMIAFECVVGRVCVLVCVCICAQMCINSPPKKTNIYTYSLPQNKIYCQKNVIGMIFHLFKSKTKHVKKKQKKKTLWYNNSRNRGIRNDIFLTLWIVAIYFIQNFIHHGIKKKKNKGNYFTIQNFHMNFQVTSCNCFFFHHKKVIVTLSHNVGFFLRI